jgi:hypothetical protein
MATIESFPESPSTTWLREDIGVMARSTIGRGFRSSLNQRTSACVITNRHIIG